MSKGKSASPSRGKTRRGSGGKRGKGNTTRYRSSGDETGAIRVPLETSDIVVKGGLFVATSKTLKKPFVEYLPKRTLIKVFDDGKLIGSSIIGEIPLVRHNGYVSFKDFHYYTAGNFYQGETWRFEIKEEKLGEFQIPQEYIKDAK